MFARNALISLVLAAALPAIPALAPIAAVAPAVKTIVPAVYRLTPGVRQRIKDASLADIPAALRQRNWSAWWGSGSCVHASMVTLLRWQGRDDLAEQWKRANVGGETEAGLARKLIERGIRFAETSNGDVKFLEWATRTRRGANVVVQGGSHMITLLGLTDTEALLVDNNNPSEVEHQPRESFLTEWRQAGGWAVVPLVGSPLPPKPWIVQPVPVTP